MLSLLFTLISVQKHTGARVGLNQTWLTDLTEELPQFVWAADSHGVKTFCSRKYLEYTGAETVFAMNSSWQTFIHPEDRIEVARHWFHSLATGEPYSAEYRLLRQDGTYRHFTAAALPISDRSGKISSWLGISKDVHDEKLAEQNRQRAAGLSSVHRLARSIAHEINNPLEGLTNALYLVRHGNNPDHGTREDYLRLAEQELERVNHVTSHSLRFHRQVGPPVMADVATVLEASVAAFRSRLQSGAIEVDRRYQSGTRLFCFDQDLRQAFEHLIRNALDAMPAGGKLSLRIGRVRHWKGGNDDGVSVTVADTGTGLPSVLREHLFEPFFSTKGEQKVGLGLWTTQQIVSSHNGHVTMRSRTGTIHHWTVFRVFLPLAGVAERLSPY